MLIGQHVALFKASIDPSITPDEYVGIICTRTSLRQIALEAAENARLVCQEYYDLYNPPSVRLVFGNLRSGAGVGRGKETGSVERSGLGITSTAGDVEFMYVPSHLHHMLFELLKNSCKFFFRLFLPKVLFVHTGFGSPVSKSRCRTSSGLRIGLPRDQNDCGRRQ
jgi:pyruvate dehydrogenase kinase 2/3/4